MKELSVRECLRAGWDGFKARPWFFIGSYVIIFIASIIAGLPRSLAEQAAPHVWSIGLLAFLVSVGLSFLVSMGKTAFFLKAHDRPQEAEFSDLWHPRPFWKFAAVSVLAGAATILGLILLIVPGIIIGIMFGFALYIMIEKQSEPLAALRESAALTEGNRWRLFLLGLALLGINIIGLCLVLVGLFATLPISALAVVHAYRVLSGSAPLASDMPPMPETSA